MARTDFTPGEVWTFPWGTLSYSVQGGGRTIFFLHGAGRNRHDWDAILPHLSRHRRCFALDLRGHGGSSLPRETLRIRDMARDLLAMAEQMYLGTIDIVGHSLGGLVALRALSLDPERVGRVALLDTWLAMRYADVLGDEPLAGLSAEEARRVQAMQHDTYVRWVPSIREDFFYVVSHFDGTSMVEESLHPLLMLYGDRGRPAVEREKLGIPVRDRLSVAWIPRGTHFFPVAQPEETVAHLKPFLLGEEPEREDDDDPLPPPSLEELMMRR